MAASADAVSTITPGPICQILVTVTSRQKRRTLSISEVEMDPPTFADGNTSTLYFVEGLSLWVICTVAFFLGSGLVLPVVLVVVALVVLFSFLFDISNDTSRLRLLSPSVPDCPDCL